LFWPSVAAVVIGIFWMAQDDQWASIARDQIALDLRVHEDIVKLEDQAEVYEDLTAVLKKIDDGMGQLTGGWRTRMLEIRSAVASVRDKLDISSDQLAEVG
jgi:hypothetical protein